MHARSPSPNGRDNRHARISCVICAYNETGRIGQVLPIALNHPLIDEVVVVDDGSTDGTRDEIATYPGAILLPQDSNRGKSHAVAVGIGHARNPIVMLLDADLVGLTAMDITALAHPVLAGVADLSISLRCNSLPIHKFLGIDFVSGERVFWKDLLIEHLDELRSLPGFACEAFINKILLKRDGRVVVVKWPNVAHQRKKRKFGVWKGLIAEVSMVATIGKILSLREIVTQNYALLLAANPHRIRKRHLPTGVKLS